TFQLCQQYVDEIITVSNDQICAAIKSTFEETRSIVEPAGALSLAGAIRYIKQHNLSGRQIATICSGANMSFEKLQFIAERTLLGSGSEALYEIELPERPGALADLCNKVIGTHNITEFSYRLSGRDTARILVGIGMSSSRDRQHISEQLARHTYRFKDLSGDDTAKEHVRHMIGGKAMVSSELIYEINFPERPGALNDFLASLGRQYNISLFHYRGQGGDVGKVLIGFEHADERALEASLQQTGYEVQPCVSEAVIDFLKAPGSV
ncbi:MAG TPA: pyridoxal-phosphate dependent enzyme, partial [Candidatus Limnocylindrales bacterium]|nr:pyridoxal-phosphate dependent enzyme [Candidatus Limnocylindrales bacterium]